MEPHKVQHAAVISPIRVRHFIHKDVHLIRQKIPGKAVFELESGNIIVDNVIPTNDVSIRIARGGGA